MKKNIRALESIAPHFRDSGLIKALCLLSPSDEGVIRNKGRSGSRYAPKAIINILKKQNNHLFSVDDSILIKTVANSKDEEEDFCEAQQAQAKNISRFLNNHSHNPLIHIGGGHDHIYPLLVALEALDEIENLFILNIDAHCDTRIDSTQHSGTPFRDFSNQSKKPFHLIQLGVQKSANSKTTLAHLKNGSVEHIFMDDLIRMSHSFTQPLKSLFSNAPFKVNSKTAMILSLDADALDGASMQGVSAVNGHGIPALYVHSIIEQLKNLSVGHVSFGIYEYNPLYDNLSCLGAKVITSYLYRFLEEQMTK